MFPDFVMAGALKCGTSSVVDLLSRHPGVEFPFKKDSGGFFPHDMHWSGPGDPRPSRQRAALMSRNRHDLGSLLVSGDATASYLYYPEVIDKILSENNDVRIVLCLRNPIDRAWSAFGHLIRERREERSFESGLAVEQRRMKDGWEPLWWYVEAGRYARWMDDLMARVRGASVRCVLFEEFVDNPPLAALQLLDFLGVWNKDFEFGSADRRNPSGVPRNHVLYRSLVADAPWKEAVKNSLPDALVRSVISLRDMTLKRLSPMPESLRARLREEFAVDVVRLDSEFVKVRHVWPEFWGG